MLLLLLLLNRLKASDNILVARIMKDLPPSLAPQMIVARPSPRVFVSNSTSTCQIFFVCPSLGQSLCARLWSDPTYNLAQHENKQCLRICM